MIEALRSDKFRTILKAGMVGCGSVLLLFLIMATVVGSLVSRHPDRFRTVLASAFDALEDELAKGFGPDVTPADRARFAAARARLRAEWIAGKLPADAGDRLRRRLVAESRKSPIRASDVRSLTDFLERLASEPRRPAAARTAA